MLNSARQRLRDVIAHGDSPAAVQDKVAETGPTLGDEQQAAHGFTDAITPAATVPARPGVGRSFTQASCARHSIGQARWNRLALDGIGTPR
jgi:hypothetical protein